MAKLPCAPESLAAASQGGQQQPAAEQGGGGGIKNPIVIMGQESGKTGPVKPQKYPRGHSALPGVPQSPQRTEQQQTLRQKKHHVHSQNRCLFYHQTVHNTCEKHQTSRQKIPSRQPPEHAISQSQKQQVKHKIDPEANPD